MFEYSFNIRPEDKNVVKIDFDLSVFDNMDYYEGAKFNPNYIENYKERIIWFLNHIKKNQNYTNGLDKGCVLYIDKGLSPLIKSDYDYLTEEIENILNPITQDKDFIRKYGFNGYTPSFDFVKEQNALVFCDFTDDFIDSYIEYKFGIKRDDDKKLDTKSEYYQVGKFEYKNNDIFFDNERIRLSPQELIIMKKFISEHILGSKYYDYDSICDSISRKNQVSIENMQKLMSKLRKTINKKTKDFVIESKSNMGYTLTIKNIR